MPSETADVIVVGAGIVGVCCAWRLAEAGVGRVLLLDKAEVAGEATRRSLGLVQVLAGDPAERPLARASLALFRAWGTRVGPETPGLVAGGCLHLGRPEAVPGDDAEEVDAATARALQPGLVLAAGERVVWEPTAGYVDGYTATMAAWWAARRAGVVLREGTPVRSLVLAGDRVVGVATSVGALAAGTVVVAAGAWTGRLLAAVGQPLPLTVVRAQVLRVEQPDEAPLRVGIIDHERGVVARPAAASDVLVGSTSWPPEPAHPARYRQVPDPAFAVHARAALAPRLPALAAMPEMGGHAGLYDLTPDNRPLLGALPGLVGLVLAGGLCGRGLRIAPAVGGAIASLVATGRAPDLAAFDPGRFTAPPPDAPGRSFMP